MKKVFIDGREGTTGLRIFDRLKDQPLDIIVLSDDERKDISKRKHALNEADIAFLCLPDDAAKEAVSLIENPNTVVIDASTAHRTNDGWAYGFPELSKKHLNSIINSKRIAVPGCYASGFLALVYPLVKNMIISENTRLSCFGISGYSGAGKKVISEYENENRNPLLNAPRQYALHQSHKHLKEMTAISRLNNPPCFVPYICPFFSGMEITVPLFKQDLLNSFNFEDIKNLYKSVYSTVIVKFDENMDENGFIASNGFSNLDSMQIGIFYNNDRAVLVARYDNLGKGASGAAVQCMNLVLGRDECFGLSI